MFDKLFEMWGGLDTQGLAILAVIVSAIGLGLFAFFWIRKKVKKTQIAEAQEIQAYQSQAKKGEQETIIGVGSYPAYVLNAEAREIQKKRIKAPMGDTFVSEPSLLITGNCSLLLQQDTVIPWNPLTKPYVADRSSVFAWLATNWDLVSKVFSVPTPWWQSVPTWMMIGSFVILLIAVMV